MIKLLVISTHLANAQYQVRWQKLAEQFPVQVRILVPRQWRSTYYEGKEEVFSPQPVKDGNFEVRPVATSNDSQWWTYTIKGFRQELTDFAPDVIFCIHDETMSQLQQTLICRSLYMPKAKVMFFSTHALMGLGQARNPLRNLAGYLRWMFVRANADAVGVHYPDQADTFRSRGFKGKVYVQTQVGIDPGLFHPDTALRHSMRERLGLKGFTIGFAGRMREEKGIFDLLNACAQRPFDGQLLFVGDGPQCQRAREMAAELGLGDRAIFTGKVPAKDVPHYMCAMDAFFTGSLSRRSWIDTFPNAIAQAMACRVPVIGSNSGAIPYMLADTGLVYPEGDAAALRDAIDKLRTDPALIDRLAQAGMQRSLEEFCVPSLAGKFHTLLEDLLAGAGK